ncbi:MAG TPA: hypothetical protein VGC51_12625 [Hansschlegelia sp.]
MRRLVLSALLALVAGAELSGASPAWAQDYYRRYYDEAPPSYSDRARRQRADDDGAYYDRRQRLVRQERRIPDQAERRRSGFSIPFLERLFGRSGSSDDDDSSGWGARRDPGAVEVRPPPRTIRRRPPATEARTPPQPPPLPPNVVAAPVEPPPPATTFVAVIGDAIADELAGGLEEAFADTPDVAVRRHVKPNGGLVRADYFDFVQEAQKALADDRIAYAVIDVGVNDRQPFTDGPRLAPLSDEWMKRYAARVDALLALFKAHGTPVYWVGLAPSESLRASSDHTALNALIKERVEAAGGTYVDVWEGFVDEDGAYEAEGPQLDGQIGRLRLDDGVRFSKAGARKLAHYVEREIRKVYKPKAPSADAIAGAVAPEGDPQSPLAPGTIQMARPRPLSSPLVVLTAPRRAENGALAAAALAIPARDASPDAERVLVNGESPDAEPGRLDDHRWPGGEAKKPETPEAPKPSSASPQP